MKQIAVVCALGVLCAVAPLLAGCDDPQSKARAVLACADDDDAVTHALVKFDEDSWKQLDINNGDLHNTLVKAISACEPVIPTFSVNNPNSQLAEISKICKSAYEGRVQVYKKILSGVNYYDAINLLSASSGLIGDCKYSASQVGGLIKSF